MNATSLHVSKPRFAVRNLSVLAYANGFTLWHYKSANDISGITGDNYFGPATDMLSKGDMIMINSFDAARIVMVVVADVETVRVMSLS